MILTGMVCPRSGQFFAIEASHSDAVLFQSFLDEAGKSVELQRPKNVLIVDNACWHKKKRLELARLAADVFASIFTKSHHHRTHLVEHEGTLVQQLCL